MGIRVYKPTTAGRRNSSVQTFEDVTVKSPFKPLVQSKKQRAGRSGGKIAVRHKGGGVKRHTRIIDWKFEKIDIPATVKTIEYDPNRGARIALVAYADGEKRYVLAPKGLKVGMQIATSNQKGEPQIGNRFPLHLVPLGMSVYNIELQPGRGGQLVRGAGTSAMLLAVEGDWATVKMPSGETRMVSKECMASIGDVSNPDWRLIRWGKAGRTRMRSIRPTVRGKVMNPVDHPHGGGEARNSIGLKHPKTPQGKPALGVKTRRNKTSNKFILSRRKSKKK
ncbi:50S ribosomal protein L2 [Candidatus Uhrbacteria bacterium CG_4_9_14_0_2_um_filter_41_50]|uniref:Large ribosomal subunit protein uL2 n=1 Tax=Candidatus Uhrbacteria bacterium CG_4_9_14_0_2_um_filter_41_50 TaxID=1975031 RepID=A0A2M8EQ94_9BACT|nr:MAG: 50S ribosomal protein L2 [Candidatus Uhrbacteria bacterium CG_4_10_14_3_um_filter_41_21]PIZ55230.1 MAG: 50S ribosomal protein L2 [Candidatus Uhrbacteria bacterium CG_4_10_14_0_2_um_filter_41_21]PJB84368.1 MAG: 50S ribosomal protein L2 [Candidatus Uhrbacteria bacterium CG_4_9_14_0_8_um_filter_41_16]PJC24910.1 MAG: 50S ribosomal protein L2 [Candidatus Uhrbacteria bacterium CG_4_9_14_0_2_um_filter_41_50]PJE74972.1 MAG: 50S ribosomal protein L2 [Candidatus Uhrbacteria bacterium CG10_big_fil